MVNNISLSGSWKLAKPVCFNPSCYAISIAYQLEKINKAFRKQVHGVDTAAVEASEKMLSIEVNWN